MSYLPPNNTLPPPPMAHSGEILPSERQEERKKEDDAGTIGLGFDLSCGSITPTIKLGGGLGIGMDGHLTFGF